MKSTFIVALLISPLALLAQRQIVLNESQKFIANRNYVVENIVDSTNAKDLGKVYVSGTAKAPIKISNLSVAKHLKSYFLTDTSQKKVIPVLKELKFSEKIGERYLVDGVLNIQLNFYMEYDGDIILIYQAKAGSNYQRSISFGYEDKLGGLIASSLYSSVQKFNSYIEQNHLQMECFNTGSLVEIMPLQKGPAQDTLFYNEKKLSWENFKAEPRGNSKFAAAIFPSFNIRSMYKMENGKIKATIFPAVFMVESMSWVKSNGQNEYSLVHEKLHFDIAYISAMRLLNSLKSIVAYTQRDLQSYIQYEYLEAYKYMNKMQELYDEETKHGTIPSAQQNWELKIQSELTSLE